MRIGRGTGKNYRMTKAKREKTADQGLVRRFFYEGGDIKKRSQESGGDGSRAPPPNRQHKKSKGRGETKTRGSPRDGRRPRRPTES